MSFGTDYAPPPEDLINLESKKDNTLITTQAFRTKSVNNVQVDVTSEKNITIDVSAFGFSDISDVNASIVSSTNLTIVNFDGTNLTVQSTTNGKSAAIHSLIGLPLSRHSAVASRFKFFSIIM